MPGARLEGPEAQRRVREETGGAVLELAGIAGTCCGWCCGCLWVFVGVESGSEWSGVGATGTTGREKNPASAALITTN